MIKNLLHNLTEAVRKRSHSSEYVPIYHKNSPLGKYITKQKHDEIMGDPNVDFYTRVNTVEFPFPRGIHRGRIGNTRGIVYKFHPRIDANKEENIVKVRNEVGRHTYDFKTRSGRNVNVSITHEPSYAKSAAKGLFNRSSINFTVDHKDDTKSETKKRKKTGKDYVEIVRGVLTAVRHHAKSHNPDIIEFSAQSMTSDNRDRIKLYKYLTDKLAKNKYDIKTNNPLSPWSQTNFVLTKRKKLDPSILAALKTLDKMRKDINRNKKRGKQNGIKSKNDTIK